jgi:hypothetical protein
VTDNGIGNHGTGDRDDDADDDLGNPRSHAPEHAR